MKPATRAAALLLVLAGSALARAKAKAPEPAAYYYGSVNFFSPDGKRSFGSTVSLAKRTIGAGGDRITEVVIQPAREAGQKAKEIVTTMNRIPGANAFTSTDKRHSFTGKLTFEGTGKITNNWTYDIKLKDGSKLTGAGSLDSEGMKTSKTFLNPKGEPATLIKEDLKAISLEEYRRHRKELLGK